MEPAPLYSDLADAPEGGEARWVEAPDGVRLRLAYWRGGDKGTILIFPGRTEFIEKYGRTVTDLQGRGYSVAVIDWRGQGLSDRLAPNRKLGHVGEFADYQIDVRELFDLATAEHLPEPFYICAHSMGGAIALRALQDGLPVRKTAFSAPMWGLTIDPLWRPLVQAIAVGSKSVGFGEEFAPGTGPENYLLSHPFEGNVLTSSEESWNYLRRMVEEHPGLEIGGPSIQWVYEAMNEMRDLVRLDPPEQEVLCLIGSAETVVDRRDIIAMMERWKNGHLGIVTGARHEILMETPEIRKRALDMIDVFYSG